jgi:hypothetical protein
MLRVVSVLIVSVGLAWFPWALVSESASRRGDIISTCQWKGTCSPSSVSAGVVQYHVTEDGFRSAVWQFQSMAECQAAIPKQPKGTWSCEPTR